MKLAYEQSAKEILEVITAYLDGIFRGDMNKLDKVFHDKALLYGDIHNGIYLKSKEEYLEVVKNRKSPFDNKETFRMKIISIEITGNIAYAKLHCPMLGFNYYDYLAICKIESSWKVVNKLFTHEENVECDRVAKIGDLKTTTKREPLHFAMALILAPLSNFLYFNFLARLLGL
jgi:hypothetical protein